MSTQKGLTLIELMVAVAVMAILLTVGAPGIRSLLQQNKVIAAINDISTAARTARFTAIDEEMATVLCPTIDYSACSSDWALAKMVFIDSNGNGSRDTNEPIILATDPLASTLAISGANGSLVFQPDGSVSSAATVKVCPGSDSARDASAVLISLYGRIAVAVDNNGSGIKEDLNGADLNCS